MTKEELIALAKKKGFESEFLYNKPYKYSNKESLRWLFWLTEIQAMLRKHLIWVEVTIYNENSYNMNIIRWAWIMSDGDEQIIIGEYVNVLATGIEIALNKLPDEK
jgi:hypothetical protein